MTAAAAAKAPTRELGAAVPGILPSWKALGGNLGTTIANREEHVPELRWPTSIKSTYPMMAHDSQLHALMQGTVLPVSRYAWGIDDNGARGPLVEATCADWNLPLIEDAIALRNGQRTAPLGRAKNRFSFSQHRTYAFRALELGPAYFEQVGVIGDDGQWHPTKLLPLPARTIGQIRINAGGGLEWIKQATVQAKEIPVTQLVAYVWAQTPGDWVGTSMYRPCYREWLIKDRLLRIDAINHEKAGGILLNEAPEGASPAQIERLGELAASARVGGGGAVPAGTNPIFIRATGSDVIGSINRHDEAMARAFLLMAIQLGATKSGSRAVAGVQQELWGYSQLSIADWFIGTFNEHVIEDYVDWNWDNETYVPRLVYVDLEREQLDPAQNLQNAGATLDQAVQAALAGESREKVGRLRAQVARESREYRAKLSRALPYLFEEHELEILGDITARDAEVEEELHTALTEGLPRRSKRNTDPRAAAADTPLPLPDRPLRRDPYQHEILAAVDFAQLETDWQARAAALIEQWQAVRATQIAELAGLITDADGDMVVLAQLQATAAGGDLIAAQLKTMAGLGAGQALGEAARQGVTTAAPDLTVIEEQLAARSAALEQLLARSLSEAAARRAVNLSGGALTPSAVAAETVTYLSGLTDTYLNDQFGGALTGAQNAGRLAVMDANGASRIYASELLDQATCPACEEVDGKEYASIEEASADYPGAGYFDCQGGPRCRGSLVGIYDEAAPSEGSA